MRVFCLSVGTRLKLGQAQGLMLGQMLAQELQGAVLTCWVILSLNTYVYTMYIVHRITSQLGERFFFFVWLGRGAAWPSPSPGYPPTSSLPWPEALEQR